MHLAAIMAALLAVGGCSSQENIWGEYFRMMRQSISNITDSTGVTRGQAASIPYASIGYRINGGRESLLVLATDNSGELMWTSASHVVLLTRDGRVARSVGLPHDIAATMAQGASSLPPLSDALRAQYRSTRLIDLPDIGYYGIVLSCVTSKRGPQIISIIGIAIPTERIDETCRSSRPHWAFTDNYWIDPVTGFTWHSVQHLHPSGIIIQMEIFRPPG